MGLPKGGSRPGSGRKPGKAASVKRAIVAQVLTDVLEKNLWAEFLESGDQRVKWEAFKLAKAYKSGQPPRAVEDREQQQIIIVNHIPRPERAG